MTDLKEVIRWFLVVCGGIIVAYVAIVLLGTAAAYGLSAVRQLLR